MQLKGLSWAPTDPACYVSIAHAVTVQGDPRQGACLTPALTWGTAGWAQRAARSFLSMTNGISPDASLHTKDVCLSHSAWALLSLRLLGQAFAMMR